MKIFNYSKGVNGEEKAIKFLKKKKFKIIAKNYKTVIGEIDIIAKEKAIVFVEVKLRETSEFGRPCEAVNKRKQQKIRLVAEQFLKENNTYDVPCRFDVIEILGDDINHIENAF